MTSIEIKPLVENYVEVKHWRVNENANAKWSFSGLQQHIAGAILSDYSLDTLYTPEIKIAHKNHQIHIHDLDSGGKIFYCMGHSLKDVLTVGFGGVAGKVTAKPAKHFDAILGQIVNFIGTLQNEASGAQAFSSFDTYLAPFIRYDELTEEDVKQSLQEFIFSINQSSRWGNQIPFFNITLDLKCPTPMRDEQVIIGGKKKTETYKEFQKEMDMFNKALMDLYIEGDGDGRPFTFPLPTINLTKDFDWDNEVSQKLFFLTGKYGTPTFQTFINSELSPDQTYSMCPLTHDTKVLVKNKYGVSSINIGSLYNRTDEKHVFWTPTGWKQGRPIKTPNTDIVEIKLSNGLLLRMGVNHLQPVLNNGTLKAEELKENMWLPFNKQEIPLDLGNYNLGYIIGAYLGDGSSDKDAVIYSLNTETDGETIRNLKQYLTHELGFTNSEHIQEKCVNLRFNGANKLINDYVLGLSTTKTLTQKCFSMSLDFKNGFIDGWKDTDGTKDYTLRCYTASPIIREQIHTMLSMMGRKCLTTNTDSRDTRYGKNPVYRVDFPKRDNYGDLYKSDNEYNYYRIISVTKKSYNKGLYCIELKEEPRLFMLSNGLITHNCRLRIDKSKLENKQGGLFGAGEKTGSIGVVTINLPQLGYLFKNNKELFFKELDRLMELSSVSLEIKRKEVENSLKINLIPYTKKYLGTTKNHFSTIGITGGHECCQNFFNDVKKGIDTAEGKAFMIEVLTHMRDKLVDYQKKTGNMYNLEATPAESCGYRFARYDVTNYKDIITAGTKTTPYYTNSTQLPVDHNGDVFDAFKHQDELQTLYTGGTIMHCYLGERISDWRATRNLVKKIAESFKLPYFTISPVFTVCPEHGYMSGEKKICDTPDCKEDIEVYARIVGYYRPVSQWNGGKKTEYKDRKAFNI